MQHGGQFGWKGFTQITSLFMTATCSTWFAFQKLYCAKKIMKTPLTSILNKIQTFTSYWFPDWLYNRNLRIQTARNFATASVYTPLMLRQGFCNRSCKGNEHGCTEVCCSDNEQFHFDPIFSSFTPLSSCSCWDPGSSLRIKVRYITPYAVIRAKTWRRKCWVQ